MKRKKGLKMREKKEMEIKAKVEETMYGRRDRRK